MQLLLRQEWFGALLGETHSYNLRVLNRSAFAAIHAQATNEATRDEELAFTLRQRGFDLARDSVRVATNPAEERQPILSAPVIFWIELTSICPQRCLHCFRNCGSATTGALPVELVKRLVRELWDLGVFRVTLTGGEPLLYPGLGAVLCSVNELGMGLRLFSSGLVSTSMLRPLKDAEIDILFLSIDGCQAHHDLLRGKSAFRRVMHNLALVSKFESVRNITLSITLDEDNSRNMEDLFKIAHDHGVKTLLLRPLLVYPRSPEVDALGFKAKKDLFERCARIEELASTCGIECQFNKIPYLPLPKKVFDHDTRYNASLWNILGMTDTIDCVGGNLVCGVRSDGVIVPCGFLPLDYDSGPGNSVLFHDLRWLWHNSSNLRRLRQVRPNPTCSACPMLRVCNGGCRANALLAQAGLDGIDPYCILEDTCRGPRLAQAPENPRVSEFFDHIDDVLPYVSQQALVSKCGWATY